ncbi:MAG: Uma2 family endonuclease [Candidatus Competibacteraceae bacterium]
MSTPNPLIRFHYEDYQSLPESMSARYELLDGDLLMVPAPTVAHQRILRNLGFILQQFVREYDLGEILYSPIDVVFGAGDDREIAQPDILFVDKTRSHIITPKEIQGAPTLIVEILSERTKTRDRTYKKVLYGRYGVREYWIIDPDDRTVEVYVPGATGFELSRKYSRDEILTSDIFPGLQITLEEVFQEA